MSALGDRHLDRRALDQADRAHRHAITRPAEKFGDGPVTGDTRSSHPRSPEVGRRSVFALLIMVVSFLPVFALSGMEGKCSSARVHEDVRADRGRGRMSSRCAAILPLVLRDASAPRRTSVSAARVRHLPAGALGLMERHRGCDSSVRRVLGFGFVLADIPRESCRRSTSTILDIRYDARARRSRRSPTS